MGRFVGRERLTPCATASCLEPMQIRGYTSEDFAVGAAADSASNRRRRDVCDMSRQRPQHTSLCQGRNWVYRIKETRSRAATSARLGLPEPAAVHYLTARIELERKQVAAAMWRLIRLHRRWKCTNDLPIAREK
jgi:hypothetical protein